MAERAMWFPGPALTPAFWSEPHVSAGSTTTATRWVVPDVHAGGPGNTQTFVLVANTSAFEGRFELSKLTNAGAQYFGTYTVPANSRTTIPIAFDEHRHGPPGRARATGERFGLLIASVGSGPPAQLVVERSIYWDAGGVVWAAGTNALATPLP